MLPADLIARHRDVWRAAVTHPFLQGVRDGSLASRAFNSWLAQDYLFVRDLLSFQARLLAEAPRPCQRVLAAGLVALEAELSWFEANARERGMKLDERRHPTTDSYRVAMTRWLEAGVDPALTALWALERVYLEAWRSAAPGAPEYRSFVEHWTVPQFSDYVRDLESLVVDDPRCESAFLEVCKLEQAFWDMAWTPA
jgi:thiaminase/transcriptional activator TenA